MGKEREGKMNENRDCLVHRCLPISFLPFLLSHFFSSNFSSLILFFLFILQGVVPDYNDQVNLSLSVALRPLPSFPSAVHYL
jgi:hypothetical protein